VLFLFFLPLLALIPFWLMVEGFIPSLALRTTAGIYAILTGAAFVGLLWPAQVREIKGHWAAARTRQTIQSISLLAFTPLFGTAIGYGFVHGPLSYALHNMSTSKLENVTEHVISADDFGGRRCRNRALLEGNSVLWHRQVCGISDDAVTRLRRGGSVQLVGSLSRYGIHVQRYAVVIANPSFQRSASGAR
jgi:hypothetical protein